MTISLKDALDHRPGSDRTPLNPNRSSGTSTISEKIVTTLADPTWWTGSWSCTPMWTAQEFRTFERLTAMACSHLCRDRSRGKYWLEGFKKKHGHAKCSMMLDELRRRDEHEWFSKSKNGRKQ